jgi:ABC-2 type transport system permease protein
MPWGAFGSIVYFAVVTAVVFAAALVVINRRDA